MIRACAARLALAAVVTAAVTTSAPAFGTPAAPLTDLSTRFDSPAALEGWREHVVPGFSPKWAPPRVEAGVLVLRPSSSAACSGDCSRSTNLPARRCRESADG